jgi:hypothetical protein
VVVHHVDQAISMEIGSFNPSGHSSVHLVEEAQAESEHSIVLALQAAPVDFGQLDLQPHELNVVNS